jgi:Protein of unknown function (DUF3568)
MRRTSLLLAALGALAATPGCRTVAPVASPTLGASGYNYGGGKATQEFAYPFAAIQSASVAALEDLQVGQIQQRFDGPSRSIQGTTADGRAATVTLRQSRGSARVVVRVGWFGDEPFSKAVMERIGVRLGSLPPAAIPEVPPSAPASNPFFSRSAVSDAAMLRDEAEAPFRDTVVPRD